MVENMSYVVKVSLQAASKAFCWGSRLFKLWEMCWMIDNRNSLTKCLLLTALEIVIPRTSLGCFTCLVSLLLYSVAEDWYVPYWLALWVSDQVWGFNFNLIAKILSLYAKNWGFLKKHCHLMLVSIKSLILLLKGMRKWMCQHEYKRQQ